MEQPDFFAIPSPCIGICQSNNKGYCKGCYRSRDERLHWFAMSDEQKHHVMRLLAMRKKKVLHAHLEKQTDYGEAPEQESLWFTQN